MADLDVLGSGTNRPRRDETPAIEAVITLRPLSRILAFSGRSIHDVINDPIARNEVRGWYRVHRQVLRMSEVGELERQWNPLGTA